MLNGSRNLHMEDVFSGCFNFSLNLGSVGW